MIFKTLNHKTTTKKAAVLRLDSGFIMLANNLSVKTVKLIKTIKMLYTSSRVVRELQNHDYQINFWH